MNFTVFWSTARMEESKANPATPLLKVEVKNTSAVMLCTAFSLAWRQLSKLPAVVFPPSVLWLSQRLYLAYMCVKVFPKVAFSVHI